MREGKDALALGNISGAMVFQSTIPVGIGLIFTEWELSGNAALSVGLGLAGGLLAYAALHRGSRFSLPAVIAWFALYASFIAVVALGAELAAVGRQSSRPGSWPSSSASSSSSPCSRAVSETDPPEPGW